VVASVSQVERPTTGMDDLGQPTRPSLSHATRSRPKGSTLRLDSKVLRLATAARTQLSRVHARPGERRPERPTRHPGQLQEPRLTRRAWPPAAPVPAHALLRLARPRRRAALLVRSTTESRPRRGGERQPGASRPCRAALERLPPTLPSTLRRPAVARGGGGGSSHRVLPCPSFASACRAIC
jgi:hypothetical protein